MKKLLLIALLITGCASPGVDRNDMNLVIKEYYASVESITPVTLSSEVKTGMVTGASIGIIDELDGDHEDMISGGIAGALVVGLFTAIFEGDNQAFQYSLHSTTDGTFSVIQKERIPDSVNCVKVRSSQSIQLIVTDPKNCLVE